MDIELKFTTIPINFIQHWKPTLQFISVDRFTQTDLVKSSGGGKYPKMPEGWNPSDDSEDEYTPASTGDMAHKRVGDTGEDRGVKKAKVNHQPGTEGTVSSSPLPPVKVMSQTDVIIYFSSGS